MKRETRPWSLDWHTGNQNTLEQVSLSGPLSPQAHMSQRGIYLESGQVGHNKLRHPVLQQLVTTCDPEMTELSIGHNLLCMRDTWNVHADVVTCQAVRQKIRFKPRMSRALPYHHSAQSITKTIKFYLLVSPVLQDFHLHHDGIVNVIAKFLSCKLIWWFSSNGQHTNISLL